MQRAAERRRGVIGMLALAVLVSTPLVRGQGALRPTDTLAAVASLEVQIAVEEELLAELLDGYANAREALMRRNEGLARAYTELDTLVQELAEVESIRRRDGSVRVAEQLQASERQRIRGLLTEIVESRRRLELLEVRVAGLREQLPAPDETLDGVWDVRFLPTNQTGVFALTQAGALVTGEYTLSGGFSGSLEGTLVGEKVALQRIDRQLGRSMDFEGILTDGGNSIKGTWQAYELSEGTPASGPFVAERRQR